MSAGSLWNRSQKRRVATDFTSAGPIAEKALRMFILGFGEQEIQLARGGIHIDLLIPACLLTCVKPLDNEPIFLWRQVVDGSLDLLNPIHAWSLAPMATVHSATITP